MIDELKQWEYDKGYDKGYSDCEASLNEQLRITNDALYLIIPKPQYGNNICERHLIMTKEMFIMCYDAWVKGINEQIGRK